MKRRAPGTRRGLSRSATRTFGGEGAVTIAADGRCNTNVQSFP